MLEQIEEFINSMDFKKLSMVELKAYIEIVINLDQYKSTKELLKNGIINLEKVVVN